MASRLSTMEYRSDTPASATTYYSFNDSELLEPSSPPRTATAVSSSTNEHYTTTPPRRESVTEQQYPSAAMKMQRQDSGYESYTTSPRTSVSHTRPIPLRRISNGSASGRERMRSRTRPSTRRSAQSYQLPSTHGQQPVYQVRSNPPPQSAASFFQFPPPKNVIEMQETGRETPIEPRRPTPPPATTHYWTSDSTRRLEYAAIDAASRGVKGWFRRNLVPECFVPRHIPFDDDSGSVRRYRLDMDEEHDDKMSVIKAAGQRKTWPFWTLRKAKSF